MSRKLSNRAVLDKRDPRELVLELFSFSGGENKVGADQEVKANEARIIENWDSILLGGMIRSKGVTEVSSGGATYSNPLDLLIQHDENGSSALYGVIKAGDGAGDLVIKSGANINQEDDGAFTGDALCHGVSVGSVLYITNSTDNIKKKTIGVAIAALTDPPAAARERLYYYKSRLVAEGGGNVVYGSRAGHGNFDAADGFSLANDAWNQTMPRPTKGCVPNFRNQFTIFDEFEAYELFNMPDVGYRPIVGSHGCSAPLSIAVGNEGVYFVSRYPTLGVFLWNGASWINLTTFHDFPEDISFSNRIFGIYKNDEYHLFYSDGTVGYPNVHRIYNAKLGRWMKRPINSAVSDTLGYPALLTYSSNELYAGSAQQDKIYEVGSATFSDNSEDTQAKYETKDFSSRDFKLAHGGSRFPIDDVRMKLTKVTITFYGTSGSFSILASADRGNQSASQTFSLTAEGDLINTTFIVNTSQIVSEPPEKTVTKTWKSNMVGRRFSFQVLHDGASTRPKIKKIKIHAIAYEED